MSEHQPVHIETFCEQLGKQVASIGRHNWYVTRLIELSKGFPVLSIPLRHLSLYYTYRNQTLREFVMHMHAVEAADLSCPIILDEDGEIMDGRHRVMKALYLEQPTIRAVRFDVNPTPCFEED